QALEKTVHAHRSCLQEAFEAGSEGDGESGDGADLIERPRLLDSYGNERPLVARIQQRYAQVQELREGGASLNAISRQLGLAFRTARKFAAANSVEELLAPTLNRSSKLDAFKPYLTRRWNEGYTNAVPLHQELRAQGWKGSLRAVQGWLTPLRGHRRVRPEPCPPPSPRRITGWIMTRPDHLDAADQVQLKQTLMRCPDLEAAAEHVRGFAAIMTGRNGHLLDDWIATTAAGSSPQLAAFATGLRRDHAAVVAGLTLPHSSGAVEGIVNKIKFLKRQMFGRANFDLLRIRVLHYR
ncbi:transposase, partial [Planobispora siamensis]